MNSNEGNGQKKTVMASETVCNQLRDDIINHRILPAQHLFEHELVSRFGVSRTPVRSALRQLASEGFVDLVPRKGAIVKVLSVKELTDLFQIRSYLEKMAAEQVCGNQQLVARLEELITASCEKEEKNDVRAYTNLDVLFHTELVRTTGNNELIEIYKKLNEKIFIFRLRSLALPGQMAKSIKDHTAITGFIAQNKPALAGEKAFEHVGYALETLRISFLSI